MLIDLLGPVLEQGQEGFHLEAWDHFVEVFFDVFLDLVLIIVENAHVFDFVLFSVFKEMAMLPHEIGLKLFEL